LPMALPGQAIDETNATAEDKVLTIAELEELERRNIRRALDIASWKISGKSGAAALLGIPPSTLNSKIKALGIAKTNGFV
jgi:formate hydrogenlyase transcriptional activator